LLQLEVTSVKTRLEETYQHLCKKLKQGRENMLLKLT